MEIDTMSENRLGIVLLVSGPSGSGKSSIGGELMKHHPGIRFSISCTTRPPRGNEVHGKEYYFLSREEFQKKIMAGDFMEYAEVHGNYYGTLKSEVTDYVVHGTDVLLDIDVQGAMSVKKLCAEDPVFRDSVEMVFVMPPSMEILEQRLRGRGTDAEEVIRKRLENARREIACRLEYDYLLINDQFEDAVEKLEALYQTFSMATKRLPEVVHDKK